MHQYQIFGLLVTHWTDNAVTIYGYKFGRRVDVSFCYPTILWRLRRAVNHQEYT